MSTRCVVLGIAVLMSGTVGAMPDRGPPLALGASAAGVAAAALDDWDDEDAEDDASDEGDDASASDEDASEEVDDASDAVDEDSEEVDDASASEEDASDEVDDASDVVDEDSEEVDDASASEEEASDAVDDASDAVDEDSAEVDDASDADMEASDAEDEIDPETGEIEDYGDDDWAPEVEEDPADDSIAVDESHGEDFVWQVQAVEEQDGDTESRGSREIEDSPGGGSLLILVGGHRSAPSGRRAAGSAASGKPAKAAHPPARRASGGEVATAGADEQDVPYAFGGRPIAARAVPWQAQIFNPGVQPNPQNPRPIWMRQHNCGGSLIAEDWVLTAAHCIDQQKVDLGFKVRLGAQDLSQGDGLVYRIERIVRHSQYDPGNRDLSRPPNMYANDLALVKIVPEGTPQRRDPALIRPIALNRRPMAEGMPVSVTGWGAFGNGTLQAANAEIVRVDLRMMDNRTCSARPGRAGKIGPGVFCAASPTQSTCSGDSGGPVVPTNGTPVLVGVVSWGSSRCAGDARPSVYTRVDQFIGWIEQAMRLPPTRNALP